MELGEDSSVPIPDERPQGPCGGRTPLNQPTPCQHPRITLKSRDVFNGCLEGPCSTASLGRALGVHWPGRGIFPEDLGKAPGAGGDVEDVIFGRPVARKWRAHAVQHPLHVGQEGTVPTTAMCAWGVKPVNCPEYLPPFPPLGPEGSPAWPDPSHRMAAVRMAATRRHWWPLLEIWGCEMLSPDLGPECWCRDRGLGSAATCGPGWGARGLAALPWDPFVTSPSPGQGWILILAAQISPDCFSSLGENQPTVLNPLPRKPHPLLLGCPLPL